MSTTSPVWYDSVAGQFQAWISGVITSINPIDIGTPIPSGDPEAVLYIGAGSVLAQNVNDFRYDYTRGRWAFGATNTNSAIMTVRGTGPDVGWLLDVRSITGDSRIAIRTQGANTAALHLHDLSNDRQFSIYRQASAFAANALLVFDSLQGDVFSWNNTHAIIGTYSDTPTSGTKCLVIKDGTAPATPASDTALLFTELVGGVGKIYAMDEDGVNGQVAKLSGNLTTGSIVFKGSAGLLTEDNSNLFWDDTNNRLGIGTSSPSVPLHVNVTLSTDQAAANKFEAYHNTATAGTVYGGQNDAVCTHSSGTMNSVVGLTNAARFGATANATNLSGEQCFIALYGVSPSGTVTTAQGLNLSQISNFATGAPAVTITQARGLIIGNIGANNGVNGLTVSNSCAMSIAGSQTSNGGNSAVINISNTTSVPFAPTGDWSIYNASTRNNHVAGPTLIGHTTTWASGTNFISFADGTVPGTPPSNTAAIYADDVGGTVMMFCINEAGSITRLNHVNRALGGGAAATLGTIGGSGPTAAGQNSWMEYSVGGTTYWIPVWT